MTRPHPPRPTRATIARKLTAHDRISERDLQRTIIEIAVIYGWMVYHTYDSRRSSPGFPDLVLCKIPNQASGIVTQELHKTSGLIFAELKSETGRLRREQRVWIEALRNAGCEVVIWRPRDWPEIIERLQRPHQRGARPP